MTENEARGKRCPWKVYGPTCVGTSCMMWRAITLGPRYMVTYKDQPEKEWYWNPEGDDAYKGAEVRILPAETNGYCGLGGKPTDGA